MRSPRTTRGAAPTVLAVVGLVLGHLAINAAPAGAAPPIVDDPFRPPAVPAGGLSTMAFTCAGDGGGAADVDLDGPGSLDFTDVSVPMSDTSGDGRGRIWLGGLNATGGVSPTALGTYAYTIECPSGGGTLEVSIDALAPTIDHTGTGDVDGCSQPTAPLEVRLGQSVFGCFEFTNPGGAIGPPEGVVWGIQNRAGVGQATSLATPGQMGDPPLPAGGTYTMVSGLGFFPEQPTSFETFVVIDDGPGGETPAVSDIDVVDISIIEPHVLTVTSGLTPGTSCPSTGGQVDRSVEEGAEVYFCYTMEMIPGSGLDDHTVDSDLMGPIVANLMDPVDGPNGVLEYPSATPFTVDSPAVNNASWTATILSGAVQPVATTATGTATVGIAEPDPEPDPNPGADPSPAATPTPASPTFTG